MLLPLLLNNLLSDGAIVVTTEAVTPSEGVSDYGIHFTHPWEAFMGETPGEVVKMKFPENFGTMKFIAYDKEPIDAMTSKRVQSTDPSYITREGKPFAYYPYDELNDGYVLYPKPTTAFANELTGEGLAFYADEDTEDTEEGQIAVRVGSSDSVSGASLDIVDADDNVFMVYSVNPRDVENGQDEPEYPEYLRKYIRYGVAALAYGANTDGKIQSLSDYWGNRYQLGISHTKRYMRNRKQDRDYRLVTRGVGGRRAVRHPRLPDGYPAI